MRTTLKIAQELRILFIHNSFQMLPGLTQPSKEKPGGWLTQPSKVKPGGWLTQPSILKGQARRMVDATLKGQARIPGMPENNCLL